MRRASSIGPTVFLLALVICGIAVGVLRSNVHSSDPAVQPSLVPPPPVAALTPPSPPADAPLAPQTPAAVQVPAIRPRPAPASASGADAAPVEVTAVPFEMIDGLAVAFGDTILGKVDPASFSGQRGRFEPPTPQLWGSREIPYVIHPDLPRPERVEAAIRYMNANTPVRFVPLASLPQPDAIAFEPGTEHCLSALGKTGGLQPIRLSPGCGQQEILHEILHALGFVHEQSRPDRDQHVEVVWDHIQEKYRDQFERVPESWMEAERGTAFDFHSIMIYSPDAFAARPGEPTLRAKDAGQAVKPPTEGMSEGDLQRLKRLYRL